VEIDRYSVCFAKLTLLIQYTQYSQLFMEWTMPDHAIVHLHFSSGVTIRHWQRVLKRVMNTLIVH